MDTINFMDFEDPLHDPTLARARRLLEQIPDRKRSPATEKQYRDTFRRMLAEHGGVLQVLKPGIGKNTYYCRRPALHFGIVETLRDKLDLLERLFDDIASCLRPVLFEELEDFLDRVEPALMLDPPERHHGDRLQEGAQSRWFADGPQKSHSKRAVLGQLPETWLVDLWNAVPSGSTHRDAIAVCILAGPRPAEFKKGKRNGRYAPGVEVHVSDDSRSIVIWIHGVKCGEGDRGQALRAIKLVVADEHPAAAYLAQRCRENGGKLIVAIQSRDALRKAVERAGRKAFPWFRGAVTPYVCRHIFFADMKKTFGAGPETARGGGHRNEGSQSSYGLHQQGRRRPGIVAVVSSDPVRVGQIAKARDLRGRTALTAEVRALLADPSEEPTADELLPRFEPDW